MADQTCIRCAAHAAATPTEEQLRWVMAGKPRDEAAYQPRPIDADQHYAEQALASAIAIFVDAYGIRNARARMQAAADTLGRSERFEALTLQTLEQVRG
jgi:hypothetical protein